MAGLLMLAACHDNSAPPQFTVSGKINNVFSGQTVTVDNNGGDALSLTANGAFQFVTPSNRNGAYHVTIATQPTGQVCTVSNGVG